MPAYEIYDSTRGLARLRDGLQSGRPDDGRAPGGCARRLESPFVTGLAAFFPPASATNYTLEEEIVASPAYSPYNCDMEKCSRRAACVILLLVGWLPLCFSARAALKEAIPENSLAPYASSSPIELRSRVERASFHLRRPDLHAVFNSIAQAFGIRLLYDRDLEESRLISDFELDNVTLQEALDAAGNITKTFVAPVDEHTGIVSPDTPLKHGEHERQVLGNFQMDELTTAQQLTEITTALRTMVDLRRVSQDTASNRIIAMGRTRQMEAARQFVRTLQRDRGEVMMDVDLFEIDSQRARELGVLPPQPFQLLYLGLAGATAGVPVLTFGGGRTFYGLNLPGATAALTYSSSAVRSFQNLQLRASEGQEANLLLGERYPVLNGTVSSSFFLQPGSSVASPGVSQGTISNSLNLTVGIGAIGPSILTVTTSPSPPVVGQPFNFTISGSGFDPSSVEVLFAGPSCSSAPCTILNGSLSVNLTGTSISGSATFDAAGNYTVVVQNNTGSPSNTSSVIVSTAAGTLINSITTVPSSLVSGQQFTFAIAGSGFDPSSTQVLFIGPGCSPCTIPTGVLTLTSTSINGQATLSNPGSYTVVAQNSSGATSNAVTVTVGGSVTGPSVSSITTAPNPPVAGQQFAFAMVGSSFDPSSSQVLFVGPGCSPCTIPTGVLTVTAASINGQATFSSAGSYTVVVQNSSGVTSNAISLTVAGVVTGPSVSSITTSPDPPLVAQPFSFTISGNGFDPFSSQVLFIGTGCSPCGIPASQLTVTTTSIAGVATLTAAGSYTVEVQNSFGLPSNSLTVTVSTVGLSISKITTSPSQPVAGQQFNFTISGTGFNLSSAQVLFTGVGCSPCTVPFGALTVTSDSITGSTTLTSAGNYSVAVQNGLGTVSSIPSVNSTTSPGFYPSIQYEDLGVKVKATAYLHAGRELTLKFDLAVRDLSGQTLNGNPIISNRQVTEQVRLRDGDNYLIAGMLNNSDVVSVNGYPWFARLPILGTLFGSRSRQRTETEFLMLIRPHVVRLSPAEERASNLIYFGKELQGLPAASAPPVVPPATPPPGAPPVPGIPQPGVPPQPGVAPQPGVPPQPGAVAPQPGAVPQFPQGIQPVPGFPGAVPGQPGIPPGFIQPVPPNPGGQPQTVPPQGVSQPGQFPPGVVPSIPPQPNQPQPGQEQR